MHQKWKPGDLVTVATVNRGLPVWSKEQDLAVSWAGEIVGPSPLGPGWWIVQRFSAKRHLRSRVYAVPEGELKSRKS